MTDMNSYHEGHDIEFLDRIFTVQLMLNELLIDHKAAVRYTVNDQLKLADEILADIYQDLGARFL